MKKLIIFLLALLITNNLFAFLSNEDKQKYFGKKGEISKEFWKKNVSWDGKKEQLKYVTDEDLIPLVKGEINDWEKREKIIKRLINKGFHIWIDTDGDDGKPLKMWGKWSVINWLRPQQINDRFILCCSETELYIIDTVPPVTAYKFSSVDHVGMTVNVQSVEKIEGNTYRFILGGRVKFEGVKRSGRNMVFVHDTISFL